MNSPEQDANQTATSTDPAGNTSEFSQCVAVINDTNYVVLRFTTGPPYTLSWLATASGFALERATNLKPVIVWQSISNGITTNRGNVIFAISNNTATPEKYFRLHKR